MNRYHYEGACYTDLSCAPLIAHEGPGTYIDYGTAGYPVQSTGGAS